MGSVHSKPRSSTSRSYSKGQSSSSVLSVIRGVMLGLAASALPFLIIYSLPSLKVFLFDVMPSLWRCSCELFTPRNLFVLLNIIILSILAMTHLHSGQQAAGASSSLQSPACDNCEQELTTEDTLSRSASEEIKQDDHKSAIMHLVDETDQHIDPQINIDLHDRPGNREAHTDDDQDNQAIITGLMVIKEVITETHLQQADEAHGQHDKLEKLRKAEPESKKTEKARSRQEGGIQVESNKAEKARVQREGVVHCPDQAIDEKVAAQPKSKKAERAEPLHSPQGNTLLPNKSLNIDSLLSEEGSIFTRVQSRPLPSARFTHKKATKPSGLDRPLSPLKMSRPILKRGDTLEATWKAICESRRHSSPLNRHPSPLNRRHYSKHSSKVVNNSEENIEGIVLNSNELTKPSLLPRRDSSLPQEEFNAKVESFISRFNEKIRIQREKSLLDYMEMVGRGAS